MKVLLVTSSFPSQNSPASGIFVGRLALALQAEGVEVEVLTPAYLGNHLDCSWQSIPVTRFRYAPSHLETLAQADGGIPVALKKSRFAFLALLTFAGSMLIHCALLARRFRLVHANWAICGTVSGLATALCRVPQVTTFRGEDMKQAASGGFVSAIPVRLALGLSRSAIGVSEDIAAKLRSASRQRYRHTVHCIPNGADAFQAKARQESNSTATPFKVIVVGSLIERKNCRDCLNAFAIFSNHVDSLLTFAGDGPLRKSLEEEAIALGIENKVRFLGTVAPERIGTVLAESDVLVLASRSEGRANAILEAMHCRVPVIASRLAGTLELIEDGESGILFDVGDIDGLASRLTHVAREPSLRAYLANNAFESVQKKRLTWSHCARAYCTVYEAALKR
jgi:glycosyltransferase involved in cell wall biosynthesis